MTTGRDSSSAREDAAREDDLARYLATGHGNEGGWRRYPEASSLEMMTAHSSALRGALLQRVAQLEAAGQCQLRPSSVSIDPGCERSCAP